MNKFSHVALFSVALLVSGSVFAMDDAAAANPVPVKETVLTKVSNAFSARWATVRNSEAVAKMNGWKDTAKTNIRSAAKTVWTPKFVKNAAVAAQEAVAEVKDANGTVTTPAKAAVEFQAATLNRVKAYAYRSALIAPFVAAVTYAIYKKRNAIKGYVLAKLGREKRVLPVSPKAAK